MNEIELIDFSEETKPEMPAAPRTLDLSEPAPPESYDFSRVMDGVSYSPKPPAVDGNGNFTDSFNAAVMGETGERLGYIHSRDLGFIGEFANHAKAGWEYLKQSYGKTFGWDEVVAESQSFLDYNRHLVDTENKSLSSKLAGLLAEQTVMNLPTIAFVIGTAALSRGMATPVAVPIAVNLLRAAQAARTAGNIVKAGQLVVKAHKVASTAKMAVSLSTKAAGMGMTFALEYGNNKEEIAYRCPNLSESQVIGTAVALTAFQSYVEVGLGSMGALGRAVMVGGFGRMIAKEGVDEAITLAIKPRVLGRLGRLNRAWRGSFVRELGSVGVEEAIEESIQSASMDLTARVLSGQPDPRTWEEIYRSYRNDAVMGFIGGVWLGALPVSYSAIVRHNRMAQVQSLTTPNQANVDDVAANNAGTPVHAEVNGQPAYINSEPFLRTEFFFQSVAQSLGGDTHAADAAIRLKALAYNLAALEIKANRAQGKTGRVTPESFMEQIITMVQNDPGRSAELLEAVRQDNMGEGKGDRMLGLVMSWAPDMRGKITRWADANEIFELRQANDKLMKEAPFADTTQARNELNSVVVPQIRQELGYDQEDSALVSYVRAIEANVFGGNKLSDKDATALRIRLGDATLREIYARGGVISGIQAVVDGKQVNLIMRLSMHQRLGQLEARLFLADDPVIQDLLKRESAIMLSESDMGQTKGIPVDSTALAQERLRSLKVGEALARLDEYDQFAKNNKVPESTVRRPAKPAKPAEQGVKVEAPVAGAQAEPAVKAPKQEVLQEPAKAQKGNRGFYSNDVVALLAGWKADTVLHEIFHHLISNALLPQEIYDALLDQFYVAAGGDDPVGRKLRGEQGFGLNQEQMMRWVLFQENAANAFISYAAEGKAPSDPALAKVFARIQRILKGSHLLNEVVLNGGNIVTDRSKKLDIKKIADVLGRVMGEATPDALDTIYSQSLDQSMAMSRTEDVASAGKVQRILDEVSKASGGVPAESLLQNIMAELDEVLPKNRSLETLDQRHQLLIMKKAIALQNAIQPEAKGKAVLYEPGSEDVGVESVARLKPWKEFLPFIQKSELAVEPAAVKGSDGQTYSGPGHIHAVMKAISKGAQPVADGAVTMDQQFVSRKVANLIVGGKPDAEWESGMGRAQQGQKFGKAYIKQARKVYRTERANGLPPTLAEPASMDTEPALWDVTMDGKSYHVRAASAAQAVFNLRFQLDHIDKTGTLRIRYNQNYANDAIRVKYIPELRQMRLGLTEPASRARVEPETDTQGAELVPEQGGMTDAEYRRVLMRRLHSRAVVGKDKATHQELHDILTAQDDYIDGKGDPITSISQLDNDLLVDFIYRVRDELNPAEAVRPEPEEAKELLKNLPAGTASDLNMVAGEGLAGRVKKLAVRLGHRIEKGVLDFMAACNVLGGNDPNSPFIKLLAVPLNDAQGRATALRNKILGSEFYDVMKTKQGRAWEKQYKGVKVGGRVLRVTEAIYLYVQSDLGKNPKSATIELIKRGTDGITDEVIRDSIRFVESDPALVEFVKLTQDLSLKSFMLAIPVLERVTGRKVRPISGAYARIEHEDGDLSQYDPAKEFDEFSFRDSSGILQGMPAPKESRHRVGGGGSRLNMDYFGLFVKHISTLSNYTAKADVVSNLLNILSSPSLVNGFADKMGDTVLLETMQKLLRREMSASGQLDISKKFLDQEIKFITGNAAQAMLSFNFMTPLTQMISIPLFLGVAPMKLAPRFIGNLFDVASQFVKSGMSVPEMDLYKQVERDSPHLLELYQRKSMRRVDEMLNAKGAKGLFIGSPKFNRFLDAGMAWIRAADMVPRLAAYKTALDSKMDDLRGGGLTETERVNRSKQYAADLISRAFNAAHKYERGMFQSEASAPIKSAFIFTSQPFAQMRWFVNDMWLPMAKAWQKSGVMGVATHAVRPQTMYKLSMGCVLPGLAMGMIARRRPQMSIGEVLQDTFLLGLGGMVPILGHALWFHAIYGYGSTSGDVGGMHGRFVSEMMSVISDVSGRKADFRTLKSAITTAELLARVPDYPVRIALRAYDSFYIKGGEWDRKSIAEAVLGKKSPAPK